MKTTRCDLGIDPALALFTTFFDADQLGPSLCKSERAYPRRLLQPVHRRVNGRDGYRRAATAVHLFVEVTENDARRGQNPRADAHNFGDGDLNIAVSDYGARADDQFRLQSNGVQGPGIGNPFGLAGRSCAKKYTFVKHPFHPFDIVRETRKIKTFEAKAYGERTPWGAAGRRFT
jgi:hypothetical protein